MSLQRAIWLKPLVFLLASLPAAWLVLALFAGRLGPNPIEAITDATGEWALRFLLLGLALTPLRWWLSDTWPIRLRRMLGLFAFFYLCLHVLTYLALDQRFDWRAIGADVLERPYITAGLTGFLILVPLAVTSTRAMARRLGRRWQSLHRWVYLAALAGVVHYAWLARGDRPEPVVYLVLLGMLLSVRFWRLART